MKFGDVCEASVRRRRQTQKGNIMKTLNTDNHNDNDSATLHVYDKSTPSTSLDILAEALVRLHNFKKISKEAIAVLGHLSEIGNTDASILLATLAPPEELSETVKNSVTENFMSALEQGHPSAFLPYYQAAINSNDPNIARQGLTLLCEMGEDGDAEAFWILAQYYSDKGDPLSVVYGEKAEQFSFPPAKDAMSYARAFSTIAMLELTKQHDSTVKSLNKRIKALVDNSEEQKLKTHSEAEALIQHISYWKMLAEDAEARLATLNEESLRDEAITQLKKTIAGLEDQVLEVQCGQEKANAEKDKAERLADKLTSRNKHLVGLLRKNRIAVNEFEASSSTEDQTHV